VAAYYPEHPAAEDEAAGRGLIAAIARLYPCTHCRAAFAADVAAQPPHLGSREAFSLWMCSQHNRVNVSLGKETFPCTLKSLDERWRTGRPECWGGVGAPSVAEALTAEESLGQAADEGV
jgi:mitochondrial FAD-linked sulfhydryl oxidase